MAGAQAFVLAKFDRFALLLTNKMAARV